MGNKQGKQRARPKKEETLESAGKNREESGGKAKEEEGEEASPFMNLKLLREYPHGTVMEHELTVNPTNPMQLFKADLQELFGIPAEFIKIYRHFDINCTSELPNNRTLRYWQIPEGAILKIRDGRENYQSF